MNKNEKRQNIYGVGKADRRERPNMGTFLTEYTHIYYTSE